MISSYGLLLDLGLDQLWHPLNSLIDLLWRTIATLHTTMCATDNHLSTIIPLPLQNHAHMACANRSMDMYHLLLIGSIKSSFQPVHTVTFNCQYKPQMKMYIVSFYDSTHPIYLKKIHHYGHYSLLAIC